jgi:hypothetical protein
MKEIEMAHLTISQRALAQGNLVEVDRRDPRAMMWARLPEVVQPFLTWLTARPAPGEVPCRRTAVSYVVEASAWTLSGILVGAWGFDGTGLAGALLVALGAVLTC